MTSGSEQALLFCIARRDLDDARKDELRNFLRSVDWNHLSDAARRHGLVPLLHRHLSAVQDHVPSIEFERIKHETIENSRSILYLITQLQKLLNRFNEEGLECLVFKGPVLAQIAYGEICLRQAGDLDLLIKRSDFSHVRSVLQSLGYQMAPALTAGQQAAHLGFHCEIQFMRDNWFTIVDLHWSLTPKAFPLNFDVDEVMARAQRVSLGGQLLNTLAPEDLILFQSVHGAKHFWSRLEWISSLAEVIRSNIQIDWQILINRAQEARAVRILALGLHLAEDVGKVEIPQFVFDEIDRNGTMKTVANEIIGKILKQGRNENKSVRGFRENLKIMDRKRDVVASLLRAVFVPTISDWETLTLPGSMYSLYYILRPFRLFSRYAASLWQTLMSRSGFQNSLR